MNYKVAEAIGMLRGVSYGASQPIAEGIIDAVEMLEDALKPLKPAEETNFPFFFHTKCIHCKHGVYKAKPNVVYCQKLEEGISIEMPPNGYCSFAEREEDDN